MALALIAFTSLDRKGIGMASEARKRAREAEESEAKRSRVDDEQFRDRVVNEYEQRRTERRLYAARRLCEQLDKDKV
jgi:hypothetical protein